MYPSARSQRRPLGQIYSHKLNKILATLTTTPVLKHWYARSSSVPLRTRPFGHKYLAIIQFSRPFYQVPMCAMQVHIPSARCTSRWSTIELSRAYSSTRPSTCLARCMSDRPTISPSGEILVRSASLSPVLLNDNRTLRRHCHQRCFRSRGQTMSTDINCR